MAELKTNYTAADIENIDSETLARMLNNLGERIEQIKVVSNYNRKELDKANACLDAVSAVLKMRDKN